MVRYKILILILAAIIIFNYGCSNEETLISASLRQEDEKIPYEKFTSLPEIKKLQGRGVDINSIIQRYINDVSKIIDITYNMEYCNLLDDNETNDLILKISVIFLGEIDSKDIICLFINQKDNQLREIFSEMHKFARYETAELLGSSKKQIILITDNSGNGYTIEPMRILSYNEEEDKVEVVFDEILCAYNFLPNKKTEESEYYSISFENEYTFIKGTNKTMDILWSSKIFEEEKVYLQTGTCRFVFNGKKFIADNYYDYAAIAKQIYDKR